MSRPVWHLILFAVLAAGGAAYYYLGHGKETLRNVTTSVGKRLSDPLCDGA